MKKGTYLKEAVDYFQNSGYNCRPRQALAVLHMNGRRSQNLEFYYQSTRRPLPRWGPVGERGNVTQCRTLAGSLNARLDGVSQLIRRAHIVDCRQRDFASGQQRADNLLHHTRSAGVLGEQSRTIRRGTRPQWGPLRAGHTESAAHSTPGATAGIGSRRPKVERAGQPRNRKLGRSWAEVVEANLQEQKLRGCDFVDQQSQFSRDSLGWLMERGVCGGVQSPRKDRQYQRWTLNQSKSVRVRVTRSEGDELPLPG